jgi:hypothetical protein
MLYLYTGPSIFDRNHFLILCIHGLVMCFLTVCLFVCTSVCHVSFSGEGLEFYKQSFWVLFIFKCRLLDIDKERKQFDYFLSVFLYKSISNGDVINRCVAYKYRCIGFPNFKDPAGWFSVWISPPFTFTIPICFLKAQLHIFSEPRGTCALTAPVLSRAATPFFCINCQISCLWQHWRRL